MNPPADDQQSSTTTVTTTDSDDQIRHGDLPWKETTTTTTTAAAPPPMPSFPTEAKTTTETTTTSTTPSLPPLPPLPPVSQTTVSTTGPVSVTTDAGLPSTTVENAWTQGGEPTPPPPPTDLPKVETQIVTNAPTTVAVGASVPPKKKPNGPLILGIVALILLIGAAAGGTLYFSELTRQREADIRSRAALVPACRDGRDNDGDGKIDCLAGVEDPGCFPDNNGGGGACNADDENEVDQVTAEVTEEQVLACQEVLFYWANGSTWTKGSVTEVAANTTSGEDIRLAVKPFDGTATVARFRVNEGDWTETSTKNESGEFYIVYRPLSSSSFKVEAQIGAFGYED